MQNRTALHKSILYNIQQSSRSRTVISM